ncbi:MAG: Do family serine endopeptidase [Desulfobacteraceae bacterium]|nr:MAG: Do family serine endopeptidase [Desulfobacteraceae bacterium]
MGHDKFQLLDKIRKRYYMADFTIQIKIQNAVLMICFLLFAGPASAFDRQTPVVQAVRKVGPAVVNISSEYLVHNRINPFGANPFFDNFFQDFFERRTEKRTSLGSGVIIDGSRGFILTNAHVIERAAAIKVILQDERQFDVRIRGTDPDSDLAVLQIDSETPLPSAEMGNSDDLMIGETIIAIGNPFGFSHTVTTGVISAVGRSIKSDDRVFHEFIQTDASINPGNSGGPLLNINGELIGINTAIYAKAQGIGFAIPINRAKRIISDLIRYGHVIQAWIGILVQDLDPRMAAYLGLKESQGVIVAQIEEESPAQKAGLVQGDLLLALDNRKLLDVGEYASAARAVSPGNAIRISVWRDGQVKEVTVRTKTYPAERVPKLAWRRLGVEVKGLSPALRQHYRISTEQGVVITSVRTGSYLANIGAQPGDILLQIDDKTIVNENDFTTAMINSRLKSAILLLLQRNGQVYHLTVRMAP